MFVCNKIAVTKSYSFEDAVYKALRLFPKCSRKKKEMFKLLKRKDVIGLHPTGFGKNLINQHFEIKS